MSVQNPQLVDFLLTGTRSNVLYVEGSTAWLYDCPHFLSPLYKAYRCFDRIPIHFKVTIMYVDPITKQTYDYAAPITCDNNNNNNNKYSQCQTTLNITLRRTNNTAK